MEMCEESDIGVEKAITRGKDCGSVGGFLPQEERQ